MYSLSSSYLGAACDLLTLDNKLMTNGRVTRIGEDFIEVSNALGVMALRKYEDRVKAEIKHARGNVVIEGRLYLPTMQFFRVVDMDCLATNDKREFFRVPMDETAVVSKKTVDGRKGMDFGVKLVDLSIGGCQIHSSLAFQTGQTILVGIKINGELIRMEGEIKRTLPNNGHGYNYGIQFENNSDRNKDIVCQYLFKIQKDTINEIKEKAK